MNHSSADQKKKIFSRFSWMPVGITLFLLISNAVNARPYSNREFEAVETNKEGKIRDLRQQEIDQLRITIGRKQPKRRKADLYFRLAELNLEAYRAGFFLEGRAHEKRIERGEKPDLIDRTYSKRFLKEGIDACEDILRLKINYSKMDRVYYFLAFNHAELGNKKSSIVYYQKLASLFPSSPFVFEAYREIAENYFANRNHKMAQVYFRKALEKSSPEHRAYLNHKIAWTQYRLKRYNDAIDTMKVAIAEARADDEKYVSIREEALRDMALFMTEQGRANEAIGYFGKVAGEKDYYPRMLHTLAAEFERKAQKKRAIQVYDTILKTNPDANMTVQTQAKMVAIEIDSGRYGSAIEMLKKVRIVSTGDSETNRSQTNLKALTRKTATGQHEVYRKKNKKSALKNAEAFYSVYLLNFLVADDSRHETNEIKMYLAEVKQGLGKSKEASQIYSEIVKSSDEKYSKKAGALWVGSLADALKAEAKVRKKKNPKEPSALEREFVSASDQLVESIKDTKEAREASLRSAQVLAGYRVTREEAIERSESIVEKWPNSEQAQTAGLLLIQLHEDDLKDPNKEGAKAFYATSDNLIDVLGELKSNSKLMEYDRKSGKGKIDKKISELQKRLKIGKIAAYEKEEKYEDAAAEYEKYAKHSGSANETEQAYANAISAYSKADEWEDSERVLLEWFEKFPKSDKAIAQMKSLATGLFIQGKFKRASLAFERLGDKSNDAVSLLTAAQVADGTGDAERASKLFESHLVKFPKSDDRWWVTLKLAKMNIDEKNESRATKFLENCAKGPHQFEAECIARQADIYFNLKDFKKAVSLYSKVADLKLKAGEYSPFVGYARYRLGVILEEQQNFAPLIFPQEKLNIGLKQRLDFFKRLNPIYLKAVNAGGPWAIAAMHRLARWAIAFSREIDQITPPENTPEDQVSAFKKDLAAVSIPLKKQAIGTWTQAYKTAVGGSVLSSANVAIVDALADFRQKSPSRAQGFYGDFRFVGVSATGGEIGHERAISEVRKRLQKNFSDEKAWLDYGNLLFGDEKPKLAIIAFERSIFSKSNSGALNNRGAVNALMGLTDSGEFGWLKILEGMHDFQEAKKKDSFLLEAKFNEAALLNYFRLFSPARTLLVQVNVKAKDPAVYDGLAISHQGLGMITQANGFFEESGKFRISGRRFSYRFHKAAQAASRGKSGAGECLDELEEILTSDLKGFEKVSYDHLQEVCQKWKG